MMQMLLRAAEMLTQGGVERPRWTAEQLLSRRLGCRPTDFYLEHTALDEKEQVRFQADVAARVSGVPLQYLLRSASFYGREFIVGPGVFIPRPETEVLIEVALELTHSLIHSFTRSPIVVDIGTGCGAIAVTLALECPDLRVTATDISASALSFARRNAIRFEANVSFLKTDLAEGIQPDSIDLMTANLPYLDSETVSRWPKELRWEPSLALDGGKDGLSFIQRLIHQAAASLRPQGRLILEMGEEQAGPIEAILQGTPLRMERVVQDLNHRDRVMVLWKD